MVARVGPSPNGTPTPRASAPVTRARAAYCSTQAPCTHTAWASVHL